MTSSLFRQEALEHRKDRLFGEVFLLQPLSITVLVGVVVCICLIILGILFWGTYARKETVRGYLVPDKGIVKAYATQQGTIGQLYVTEGEQVKAGQPLAMILSERTLQGGGDIDALMIKELSSTQAQLQERIQGEAALKKSEALRLGLQIASVKKELEQIEHSLKTQEDRIAIMQKRVDSATTLVKNKYLSEQDYQKIREEHLVQQQQSQELQRAKVASLSKLSQAESELEQLPIRSSAQMTELQNKISELKQRSAEVTGRRNVEIRSPIDGTVTALQVRAGQWQATNTPLLAIIPKDAQFQVELLLPSRAIGFVQVGQTVRIRLDPFPYQRYGIYEGVVKVISKHALLPNELSTPAADLKEPVYRIMVELKQQTVTAYGKQFPLQADMSLEADIILDKQSLFERIFEPLISLKGRL